MTTRLALVLALLLLALAAAQWWLRSLAGSELPVPAPGWESSIEPLPEDEAESLEEIEEPHLDIPEYIPPAITERPRPPMGFAIDPIEIEIAAPRVSGGVDATPAETEPD